MSVGCDLFFFFFFFGLTLPNYRNKSGSVQPPLISTTCSAAGLHTAVDHELYKGAPQAPVPAAQGAGAGSINCHSLSSGGRGLHTSTDNRLVTMLLAVAFSFYIGMLTEKC